MAGKRRSAKGGTAAGKSTRRTLRATALAGDFASFTLVPQRWVNSVVAVFLLPIAAILTQTFFTCLSRETVDHAFWASEQFWFFGLGVILWLGVFFGLPRPVVIYVFGHEFTHALWVWMMGGWVSKFRVTKDGGFIVTDIHNFWIALAPYFFPLYSLFAILLYGFAGLIWEVESLRQALFGVIGFTWCFHITFTLWMIPKGQSDLSYHGTFFSLTVIYILNLLVLAVFLVVASPTLTWPVFGQEILDDAIAFSAGVTELSRRLLR